MTEDETETRAATCRRGRGLAYPERTGRGSVSQQLLAFGKLGRVDLTLGISFLEERQGTIMRGMAVTARSGCSEVSQEIDERTTSVQG